MGQRIFIVFFTLVLNLQVLFASIYMFPIDITWTEFASGDIQHMYIWGTHKSRLLFDDHRQKCFFSPPKMECRSNNGQFNDIQGLTTDSVFFFLLASPAIPPAIPLISDIVGPYICKRTTSVHSGIHGSPRDFRWKTNMG